MNITPSRRSSALEQDSATNLLNLTNKLSNQIQFLRSMRLRNGEVEPTDSAGIDLNGRIRIMSHLVFLLNEEVKIMSSDK